MTEPRLDGEECSRIANDLERRNEEEEGGDDDEYVDEEPPLYDASNPKRFQLGSKVMGVWRCSKEADGNPNHVQFSRVPLEASSFAGESVDVSSLIRLGSSHPGRVAVRLMKDGIEGSLEWHRQEKQKKTLSHPRDRAVLIQTREHLLELSRRFPEIAESFLEKYATPFGENLLIEGDLTTHTLCIGDVLHVVRSTTASRSSSSASDDPSSPSSMSDTSHHDTEVDEVVAVLQVSFPRLPCSDVDKQHCVSSKPGVRSVCAATGLAGFFCRVLKVGSIAVGDRLVLARRAYPQRTLFSVSDLFYGGLNSKQVEIKEWRGSEELLQELLEWKVFISSFTYEIHNEEFDIDSVYLTDDSSSCS